MTFLTVPYKNQYAHLYLLLALFLVAEILVNPVGEFPLNDDCTYTKATLVFAVDGTVNIGDWPAMTLFTNMLWGALFIKIFGFSFFVLRLSTLIVAVTGITLLYKMVRGLTGNSLHAFAAGLILAFNPLFFNLSNTFMTDVNFTVLLIAGVYAIGKYMRSGNFYWLLLLLVLSLLLVLLRQYGLMLPATFILVAAVYRQRRWRNFACASFVMLICCIVLWCYERHLSTVLTSGAAYKYVFGASEKTDYMKIVSESSFFKLSTTFALLFMYLLPVSLMMLPPALSRLGWRTMLACFGASFLLYKFFLVHGHPILPNIITNTNLGPDTFYESLSDYYTHKPDHSTIPHFYEIITAYRAVSNILSCSAFLSGIILFFRNRKMSAVAPQTLAILLLCGFYIGSLLSTPSFFDRYLLPLVVMALLLSGGVKLETRSVLSYTMIGFFVWFSVAGTRDYFTVNRLRWEAYNYLTKEKGVAEDNVHAGFETSCWAASRYRYIYGADVLENQKYLIQYTSENKFRLHKSYPFQRYLPLRKDTINIFIHEDQNPDFNPK